MLPIPLLLISFVSRVHSGDRPYSCPKCDVSFACISNLRRHRKQVHPSSPIPMQDGTDGTEATVVTLDEKKPTLSRITITTPETGGSAVALDSASAAAAAASSLLSSSNLGTGGGGGDAPPVALAAAAAMSGTLLTATGAALVPANLLPNSSGIPSLILTSGPPGATILAAAPAHFSDQHSQLQPALIGEFVLTKAACFGNFLACTSKRSTTLSVGHGVNANLSVLSLLFA